MIRTLLFISSFLILTLSAIFSVYGLSFLFSGAGIGIILMGSVLELGKIVSALAYHKYEGTVKTPMRKYLMMAVVVLMVINSLGIYGFLSNAYESTKNKVYNIDSEKSIIELQKASVLESLNFNKAQRQIIASQLTDLLKVSNDQDKRVGDSLGVRSIKTVNLLRDDVKATQQKIEELRTKQNEHLEKEKQLYTELQSLEEKVNVSSKKSRETDVGPLKYLSSLFSTNMDNIVLWLIILMILTFDPLGLILILIASKEPEEVKTVIVKKRKYTKKAVKPEPIKKVTYKKRKPELSNITDIIT